MPVHDWARVEAGYFHHFHQSWAVHLADGLNDGALPEGYFALVEQKALGVEPDVLALAFRPRSGGPPATGGGILVTERPPVAHHTARLTETEAYAGRANRVGVRNSLGELVAVVEIVSPGNKDRPHSVRAFVEKTLGFLARGVSVLVIDLFPPGRHDPNGIHRAIWDEVGDDDYTPPAGKPLTVASYSASTRTAYVEPVGIGDPLPAMAVFLEGPVYVQAPLEETYTRTWERCPRLFRELVEATRG